MAKTISFDTSQSHDFATLQRKYKDFLVPTFVLVVGTRPMEQSKYYLSTVEINIPITAGKGLARNEASSCECTFSGMFNPKQSKMEGDLLGILEVGKRIEVQGGYGVPIVLFVGVITGVGCQYEQEGVHIRVTALDATWMLRGGPKTLTDVNEDPNNVIRALLDKCTEKNYAKLGLVSTVKAEKLRLAQECLDDGQLLQLFARRAGFVFAIVHGQVLFTALYTKTTPLLTLKYGQNLSWFQKETDVDKQVGKVNVTGITPSTSPLKAQVSATSIPSTGKYSAVSAIPAIKDKVADFVDPLGLTPEGTKAVAQAIFNERAMEFVRGSGACAGLPELVPGRYIKLTGMDPCTNGTYFVTRVIHHFDADGFTSKFQVGGAWSN